MSHLVDQPLEPPVTVGRHPVEYRASVSVSTMRWRHPHGALAGHDACQSAGLAGIHFVTGRSMPWSRIAIAAANSSNSSSLSTPLSDSDGDQVDPRQSFSAYLQRDKGSASEQSACRFDFTFTPLVEVVAPKL
jgi:hypothetical protein